MPKCRSCGAEIKFIQTDKGKWMPCDPDAIHFDDCDEAETLIMEDGETYRVNPEHRYPQEESYGYRSHFATCPQANKWRKAK